MKSFTVLVALCLVYGALGRLICDKKTALQSSTSHYGRRGYAYRAVDEEKNPDSDQGVGCTHTDTGDPNPWLLVDLGCEKTVNKVVIVNRIDHAQRLYGFIVSVSRGLPDPDVIESNNQKLCVDHEGALTSGEHKLTCTTPLQGRYILIRFRDPLSHPDRGTQGRYLHVCDVSYE